MNWNFRDEICSESWQKEDPPLKWHDSCYKSVFPHDLRASWHQVCLCVCFCVFWVLRKSQQNGPWDLNFHQRVSLVLPAGCHQTDHSPLWSGLLPAHWNNFTVVSFTWYGYKNSGKRRTPNGLDPDFNPRVPSQLCCRGWVLLNSPHL